MQSANPFLVEEVGGHTIEARKPGRPIGSTSTRPTRDVIKQIRWTEKEWEQVQELAKKDGKPPSEYIRRIVLR